MKITSMRALPAIAQNALRERAVAALLSGRSQTEVAQLYGVNVRTVRRWVSQMRATGAQRLEPKVRGRRAGQVSNLQSKQAERIRKLIVGKLPDQLSLPFYLWTRQAVAQLIERETRLSLSRSTISNWMARWGLSAQRPQRRAYERDSTQMHAWLTVEYPQIQKTAKARGALIYWADESGLRSDDVRGRSFAPIGQTPVIATTGKRFGCNMISAITNRGELAFGVFDCKFTSALFIDFLGRLLRQAKGKPVVLIVDGHPAHHAKVVKQWVAARQEAIALHYLPSYCPELNPDELLNHDVKLAMSKSRPREREALKAALRSHLHRRQKQPDLVSRFFQHPDVRYAAR